jgi:chloramphenicol 3-O phosphotransferase
LLPDPWFLVPVDDISGMRSTVHTRNLTDSQTAEMLRKTRRGYHRVIAALVSTGNDVIMDYPLTEPWRLNDLLDVLTGYDVTLIDVHCSQEELTCREHQRGNRPHGLAASQTNVYAHRDNDIQVDTTTHTPTTCAHHITTHLNSLTSPKAFDRLRRRRAHVPQEADAPEPFKPPAP